MITSNILFKKTLSLVNSMIFKLHHEAVLTNHEIEKDYGKELANFQHDDMTTWKYYMNMSGQYHSFDNYILLEENNQISDKILIEATEDGEVYELTNDFLLNFPRTYIILKSRGEFYIDLLNKYPMHELLIRGIIFPIPIEEVIASVDGKVLYYDKTLVEEQEYSLIENLENVIDNYLKRWNIKEYALVDNLYSATLLANITSLVILYVINHRLSKTGTYEVHSFHMNEFFKSNFALGDYVDVLSPYSKMWLYKNLKYLIKNIGRNDTLEMIIDNLFINSGLRVNEIILRTKDVILKDNPELTESCFEFKDENLFKIKHGSTTDDIYNVNDKNIISKELHSVDVDVNDFVKNENKYIEKTIKDVKDIKAIVERTKIINIDVGLITNLNIIDYKELIFENWLELINNDEVYGTMTSKTLVYDIGGLLYKVTPKEASLMALKCMLYLEDSLDNEFNFFTLNAVIDNNIDLTTLFDGLDIDDSVKEKVTLLINRYPLMTGVTDDDVTQYFLSINNWYLNYWTMISIGTVKNSFALKIILDRLRRPKKIQIYETLATIDNILSANDVTLNIINKKHAKDLFNKIISNFIGIKIDKVEELRNTVSKYVGLLNKLTSYSVQILQDDIIEPIPVPNTRVKVLNGLNIIEIKESMIKCLEGIYGNIVSNYYYSSYNISHRDTSLISYRITEDPNISNRLMNNNGIVELPIMITANIKD